MDIAPARGWPIDAQPLPAQGAVVQGFARGLRGWLMDLVMRRAGAVTVSADRITLLRDTDGDGVVNTDALMRFAWEAG